MLRKLWKQSPMIQRQLKRDKDERKESNGNTDDNDGDGDDDDYDDTGKNCYSWYCPGTCLLYTSRCV